MTFDGKKQFRIKRLQDVWSTNDYLKENRHNTAPFTCVTAYRQRAGRGRNNRSWESVPGKDLTFSFILPLSRTMNSFIPNFTQITAVSVARVLESLNIVPRIKWPNDILVGEKKICGILTEGTYYQEKQTVICGVGLNVNSRARSIDTRPVTSIYSETGTPVCRDKLLKDILDQIRENITAVEKTQDLSQIISYLNTHLAYRGEQRIISGSTGNFHATITGIGPGGELLYRDDQGYAHAMDAGEILFS
ncbi:MAG: biotin--[acetyl-CoA-carboxylase] ligase [Fibrobacterota bacterium]